MKKEKLIGLFREWKDKTLVVGRGTSKSESKVFDGDFYTDGIVNEDAWDNSPIKILYILKEVHDCEEETSECDFLSTDDVLRGYRESSNMWRKIAFLSAGILSAPYPCSKPFTLLDMKKEKNYTAVIERIAIMNLKKCAGGGTIASKKSKKKGSFEVHTKAFAELIAKEIEIISPNVIVCCNTFDECVKHVFTADVADNNLGYYFLDVPCKDRFTVSTLHNGCLVFNNYHPTVWDWFVKKEEYFDPIVEKSAEAFKI